MKISIDNGTRFYSPEELPELFSALESVPVSWDAIVSVMDDATRETVAQELAPCSEIEFLRRYLELASDDIIIG